MFSFMLAVQLLSWGMVIAASMRYTLSTSMEANEVIGLSMDNLWRSTQLFYISAPLLLYSIIKGIQDYMRYQMYGEDISFWVGGDRGVMSTNLVKYWTLFLILGAIGAWIYYSIEGRKHTGVLSAVIIVTLIALDARTGTGPGSRVITRGLIPETGSADSFFRSLQKYFWM
eukprot:g22375.t1